MADSDATHIPVLLHETLDALALAPGLRVVDGTVGLGGHSARIVERIAPGGALLAIDRDAEALARARERLRAVADAGGFDTAVRSAHAGFDRLDRHVTRLGWPGADRILLDLGVSSMQLDRPERGFSFMRDGPLDMRMDPSRGATAADLVAALSEAELADLLWTMGEEPKSRRIARAIVDARADGRIATTLRLADIVAAAVPGRGRIHPATKTFQALRVAVNDEPGALARGLAAARRALLPGGILAIITFHSLEDRPVKRAFLAWEAEGAGRRLFKKAVSAGRAEAVDNRRARSAKLRAFIMDQRS